MRPGPVVTTIGVESTDVRIENIKSPAEAVVVIEIGAKTEIKAISTDGQGHLHRVLADLIDLLQRGLIPSWLD